MIISTAKNYIFVHVPKTGGTSLALALEAKVGRDDILLGDTPKARNRRNRQKGLTARGRLWKHSTLGDIDGVISADQMAAMQVFTIVRNPWDWCVSYYHWLKAQSFDHPAVQVARQTDFEGFLSEPSVQGSLKTMQYGDYVTSVQGQERCDLFLRFEELEHAPEKLSALLGFEIAPLERLNPSDRPEDYRQSYSTKTRNLVAEMRKADIERFGYSF